MNKAMSRMQNWQGPLPSSCLLILPMNDDIVDAQLTYRLWPQWQVSPGCRKEISAWPESMHEAFNDLDRAEVFNAIETWIRST